MADVMKTVASDAMICCRPTSYMCDDGKVKLNSIRCDSERCETLAAGFVWSRKPHASRSGWGRLNRLGG
ncbi:MAG: hypothetical protein CBE43_05030 [Rhodopirellula sp. TMED283]|nr:MAG: hypothetical protein CBE43_05030 [Rhodopirellula sp. TMED283]